MTQLATKTDKYLEDFQALEHRRPPDEPAWVQELRQAAWQRFTDTGFPLARRGNEAWKYTNARPIAYAEFEYPWDLDPDHAVMASELDGSAPPAEDACHLVFIDGRYSSTLSSRQALSNGARVASLADAILAYPEVVQNHLAKYATIEEDGFTALNTAFLRDGAFVQIPDGYALQAPVHLTFVSTNRPRPQVSHPRILLITGPNSRVTVVESYISLTHGPCFTNPVTEFVLGDGSEVEHYRLLLERDEAFHVGSTRVCQGQDSTFSSVSFSLGTALARNDFRVLLDGPGAFCKLNGLYLTSGTQHLDNLISIDHAKPNTTSRLLYKGILGGKSRAVFGGQVLVRKDSQKADAQQTDKNLLLSEEAEIDSKPSLLIYADDVKCGHGATAGHLDDNTLFYLRSRGLDRETATRILVHAFGSEIIETVNHESLRVYLDRRFTESLPQGGDGGP